MNAPANSHARRHLLMFGVAVVWLASNLAKPITVDDAAYFEYASHIAAHPADPYGFAIYWYQSPQPAIEVLAPPLWLYWWAAGIRWFGGHEWAWKLWQFPFLWLFVAAFAVLARRFVREPAAGILPVFVVLSPVFLPGLNLMLDVPALALGLAGFVVFLQASDRESAGQAALAGIVVGLAMQTKYTAALVPAAMALYAAFLGRIRLALVAGSVAAAVFASWELAMLWRYGQSQFIAGLLEPGGGPGRTWALVPALVTLAGGVGSAWGFMGLAALGVRRWVVGSAMVASAAAFVAVGWLPTRLPISLPPALAETLGRLSVHANPALDLCRVLGAVVVVAMIGVLVRLRKHTDRTDTFLMAWLALEFLGYLLLSPFVAVRRVMGLAVVATLVIGRLASRTCVNPERRRLTQAVVAYSALLASLFALTDRADAVAQREAAALAAGVARSQPGETPARLWYIGHWGFQFYAERAGMEPVVPGSSLLRKDDTIAVPGPPVDVPRVRFIESRMESVTRVAVDDVLPWQTIPGYYRGAVPLASRPPGPRLTVTVYRVLADFVPESQPRR